MHPSCWFPGLQFECEQVNQFFYQSIRQDTNHGQWYQNWIVVPWDLWRTGVIIVLGLQFSAHTNDTLCKKKKSRFTLNLFCYENQKSEPLPPNFDSYNAFPGNQLFETLKTKVYQAFPLCFPPGSLDSPASPVDSEKNAKWIQFGCMESLGCNGYICPFLCPKLGCWYWITIKISAQMRMCSHWYSVQLY